MTQSRPMRRWVRWLVVRVLAFAIKRRVDRMADLRAGLAQAFPRRTEQEMTEVWREACRRAWP